MAPINKIRVPVSIAMVLITFAILMSINIPGRAQENPASPEAPLGTAFTYQGVLSDSNNHVINSTCDFRFRLYDAVSNGAQVGEDQTKSGITVSKGLFNVTLDFGSSAFTGEARWLEAAVKCTGDADYAILGPRQALTPAPYAINANSAKRVPWSGLIGVPTGFADNTDNDTLYSAGDGLELSGTQFSIDFAGSGSATTVSRSDHNHFGQTWSGNGDGLSVENNNANNTYSLKGSATATGPGNAVGVFGSSSADDGIGVVGDATATTGSAIGGSFSSGSSAGIGVSGRATSNNGSTFGVYGESVSTDNGYGVYGESDGFGGYGVFGKANSTDIGYGVYGESDGYGGYGLYGKSISTEFGYGVYGFSVSTSGYGIRGYNGAPQTGGGNATGVAGRSNSDTGFGVAGHNYNNGVGVGAWSYGGDLIQAYNGDFPGGTLEFYITQGGDVYANGSFFSFLDSSQDGTTRALTSIQSPEAWLEDFGRASLVDGRVIVPIAPDFAGVADLSVDYYVFITMEGDCQGVYVTNKTPTTFEVREVNGGKSNITFSYRIVAKPFGSETVRLPEAELPATVEVPRQSDEDVQVAEEPQP